MVWSFQFCHLVVQNMPNSSGQCIYLVFYIDDILITNRDQDGILRLKQCLFRHFQTKGLSKLKYFLGLRQYSALQTLSFTKKNTHWTYRKRQVYKNVSLLTPHVKLLLGQGEFLTKFGRYQRFVGKLNYLTITCPNISLAINAVNQFLLSSRDNYQDAMICIL